MAIVKKKAATVTKKSATTPAPKLKGSTTPKGITGKLDQFQEMWAKTAATERREFGDIPDGKYKARIEDAIIDTGKPGDEKFQVKWSYRILGPTHANRMAWQNTQLDNEVGLSMTKGNLEALELEVPEDITQLGEILTSAKNAIVEITLLTKEGTGKNKGKKFQNVYLNRLLSETESEEAPVEEGDAEAAEEGSIDHWLNRKVEFTYEKKKYTGTVTKVVDETDVEVTVDGEKDPWQVPTTMLTAVEEEAAEVEDLTGKTVQFESDGEKYQGEVTGIDKDGNYTVVIDGEEWGVEPSECTVVEAKKAVKKIVKK